MRNSESAVVDSSHSLPLVSALCFCQLSLHRSLTSTLLMTSAVGHNNITQNTLHYNHRCLKSVCVYKVRMYEQLINTVLSPMTNDILTHKT